jgi:hypothetical protein
MTPRRISASCRLGNRFAVDFAASASMLAQMRLDQPAKICQMRQLALAPQ